MIPQVDFGSIMSAPQLQGIQRNNMDMTSNYGNQLSGAVGDMANAYKQHTANSKYADLMSRWDSLGEDEQTRARAAAAEIAPHSPEAAGAFEKYAENLNAFGVKAQGAQSVRGLSEYASMFAKVTDPQEWNDLWKRIPPAMQRVIPSVYSDQALQQVRNMSTAGRTESATLEGTGEWAKGQSVAYRNLVSSYSQALQSGQPDQANALMQQAKSIKDNLERNGFDVAGAKTTAIKPVEPVAKPDGSGIDTRLSTKAAAILYRSKDGVTAINPNALTDPHFNDKDVTDMDRKLMKDAVAEFNSQEKEKNSRASSTKALAMDDQNILAKAMAEAKAVQTENVNKDLYNYMRAFPAHWKEANEGNQQSRYAILDALQRIDTGGALKEFIASAGNPFSNLLQEFAHVHMIPDSDWEGIKSAVIDTYKMAQGTTIPDVKAKMKDAARASLRAAGKEDHLGGEADKTVDSYVPNLPAFSGGGFEPKKQAPIGKQQKSGSLRAFMGVK
jgi:hypothetical protein